MGRYVGVMTGTSVDGLDVALLFVESDVLRIGAGETVPLPEHLAASLRALAVPGEDEITRLGTADAALGEFVGKTVLTCLARWGVSARDVRAIGCHGQTVRHRPDLPTPFTLQIGDPNRIAEIAGIDVVADLRRRDVAAGGEGAPLAPLFHEALFRDAERHRAVVNIGGIANVTILPADSTSILGFDTGPGNALLDAWASHNLGEPFDRHGAWAASGNPDARLLATLQADPFVAREPPKSTGKETYNLNYVDHARQDRDIPPEDVQATLVEFTAWSVATAIRRHGPSDVDVVACGGGRLNTFLMARLAAHLGKSPLTSDELGYDGDALEAAAFAWFAHRRLAGLPANASVVTGARGPRVLGAVYPA